MGKDSEALSIEQLSARLQNRLEAILDAMPVAVSWADIETQKILFVNRKFTQMFGYELGDHETVEDWIRASSPTPEQAELGLSMNASQARMRPTEPVELEQMEVDVWCKDGSVKTVLLSGMILPQEGWFLVIFSDITDRKKNEARIHQQAMEDPLTGLGNRRAFEAVLEDKLARARSDDNQLALLNLDLDDFKPLNDTLGHDQGDKVLRMVAGRIRHGVRGGDIVCRPGGDEFCVIVDHPRAGRVAEEMADRIIREVGKPLSLEGASYSLSVSIGIAMFPDDADEEEGLYRKADQALYRAKQAGRGRWCR